MRSAEAICVDYERIYASGESHQQGRWTHICVVQFFSLPRSRAVSGAHRQKFVRTQRVNNANIKLILITGCFIY